MFKKGLKKNSSKIFLVTGILLIFISLSWSVYEKTTLAFATVPEQNPVINIAANRPIEIIIPSQKIDLEIKEATVSGDKWEVNPTGASHLRMSANPGEGGNIIMYGHNKKSVLGKIRSMKKGDLISLKDENGKVYEYKTVEILTVKPTDVWVLNKSSEEVLTLYTCTGFLDSKRFVIIAKRSS